MIKNESAHWIKCIGIAYAVCLLGVTSCQHEEERPPGNTVGVESFKLTYVVPDSQPAGFGVDTRVVATRAGNVPAAFPLESTVKSLRLLFFERDDYGNGTFKGSKVAQIAGNTLAGTGEVTVDLPESGEVNSHTDYNVLVIANDVAYSLGAVVDSYCAGKTENTVRMMFQPDLPRDDTTAPKRDYVYSIASLNCLPMSGTAVKLADKDMSVSLLRAVVRVDVKIADAKVADYVLTTAELRNSPPVISLFSSPRDVPTKRLAQREEVTASGNSIFGGLYATESIRTVSSATVRMTEAICVLVNCKKKDDSSTNTWYRVNVNIDTDNVQYLRRNNVYTVVIRNILGPGSATADEAYFGDATMLKTVTIPTEWKDAGVTPPEIDI